MSNHFKNLAVRLDRRPTTEHEEIFASVDEQVRSELAQTIIEIHSYDMLRWIDKGNNHFKEVPTAIMGTFNGWTFSRAWRYWIVEGSGLPLSFAMPLYLTHGQECRAFGDGEGRNPLLLARGQSVNFYHIDTQEALGELAKTIMRSQIVDYNEYAYTLHTSII